MSETTRRRVKTLKTVFESSRWELFERNKILKIGQVLVILVHFEAGWLFSTSEYNGQILKNRVSLESLRSFAEFVVFVAACDIMVLVT